jgi:hypothetical protein
MINWFKNWVFWHEEIVFPVCPGKPWSNRIVTSDPAHGVHDREASYSTPKLWDFVSVPGYGMSELDALWERYQGKKHDPYGWWDILVTQILPLNFLNNRHEEPCHEICQILLKLLPIDQGANRDKEQAEKIYLAHKNEVIEIYLIRIPLRPHL